jgi:hypothetical protein
MHIPDVVSPSGRPIQGRPSADSPSRLPIALIPGGTQPGMGKFDGKAIQGVDELLFTIVLVIGYEHLEAKSISRIFYNGYELLVGTMPISKVYIEDILQWL